MHKAYKILGLPTFPIHDGMTIGWRDPEELEWLAKHGVLREPKSSMEDRVEYISYEYGTFVKGLVSPAEPYGEIRKVTGTYSDITTLLKFVSQGIGHWIWWSHAWENLTHEE